MSRPSALYQWSSSPVYTSGPPALIGTPTRSAPTLTEQQNGWAPGDQPAAQLMGALFGVAFDWLNWISGGEWDTDFKVDGALDVVGAVTAESTLTTGGAATVGGRSLTFLNTVFTADATSNQLAITGHGLQTGDGPLQVTNSGGALPSPLVAATNYYAILVDANHFKLATSLANAVAGTFIDLTTAGSGTNTIAGVSATRRADLEVTRNLTVDGNLTVGSAISGPLVVAGATEFKSTVTLDANTNIVLSGTGHVQRGDRVRKFSAISGRSFGSGTFPTSGGAPTGHWQAVASGDILDVPIVVEQYERITEIDVRVFGDPGCQLQCKLFKQAAMSSIAGAISNAANSALTNLDQTVAVNQDTLGAALAEDVDGSVAAYFVRVVASGAPAGSGPFVGVVTVKTTVPT